MRIMLAVVAMTTALAACTAGTEKTRAQAQMPSQATDNVVAGQIHPVIARIFYGLPLEKSRLDLRQVLFHDQRFVSTDTTFNNYDPASFFKGTTEDKGLIASNPDSIQVMLIYGNAALTTEKGGQEDTTKHPMILECKYFFSNQHAADWEYDRMLDRVHPIFADTSSIMDDRWETAYAKGKQKGIQRCVGKMYDNFDPYYRVAISNLSFMPSDGSRPVFVLDIAFSKEDQ